MKIEIELDDPRELMYESLANMVGEGPLNEDLQEAVNKRLTDLYDNRDRIGQGNAE